MSARKLTAGSVVVTAWLLSAPWAASVTVSGGSSSSPSDITSSLLANQDIVLTGGSYIVRIPQSGPSVVNASSVDPTLIKLQNNGFSATANPAINYTGTISGAGVIEVASGFSAPPRSPGQSFSGGALIFSGINPQTWGVQGVASGQHNAPALIIDSNVTVEFYDAGMAIGDVFATSTSKSRNITNNGYLYTSRQNQWASIIGSGVNVFEYNGGRGRLRGSDGSVYSGELFDFNSGTQVEWASVFENQPAGGATLLESSDITVFVTHNTQSLTDAATYTAGDPILSISQDIFMEGLDEQIWNTGIAQFTGTMLPLFGSLNHLQLATHSDAVQGMYFYGPGSQQGFGRVINLTNRPTLLMGNGSAIVVNPDGVTNNVFLQGNPFNTLLSTNNFESAPSGAHGEAIAFDYSGAYRVDFNMNALTSGTTIMGIRNNDWVNLLVLDPTFANPAAAHDNNPIISAPVFLAGLTRIDKHAVLQLGDGTGGNNLSSKTVTVAGQAITSAYTDSEGDGMLMTLGNQGVLTKAVTMNAAVTFQIVDNGKLLVDNTPTAMDATTGGASAEVAAWISANELDGITGAGSVEQQGALALTLGSGVGNANTYTGGTTVDAGATLIAGSVSALGSADLAIAGSGTVTNYGTLQAAAGVHTITILGDYLQTSQLKTSALERRRPSRRLAPSRREPVFLALAGLTLGAFSRRRS